MPNRLSKLIGNILLVVFGVFALLLVGTLFPIAGFHVRIVTSGSMSPTIPMGSAVFIGNANSYAVGNVITFQHPDEKMPTTHRIVAQTEKDGALEYTTRGDANNAPDWQPVGSDNIIGRVFFSVPNLGFVLDFLRKPLGLLILIGLPAALIVYEESQKMPIAGRARKKEEQTV